MYPVSEEFKAVVRSSSQVIATRITVLSNRQTAAFPDGRLAVIDADSDADVLDGDVKVDGRADVRRSVSLSLADPTGEIIPAGIGDLLAPPNELRVEQGFLLPSGAIELVPMGVFGITQPQGNDSGTVTLSVTGYDRSAEVSAAKWTDLYVIAGGTNLVSAVRTALADRVPTLPPLNSPPIAITLPQVIFGDTNNNDPWADLQGMVSDYGYELLMDPAGIPVLRSLPDATSDPVVATYDESEDSTVLTTERRLSASPGYNGVIVVGEGSEINDPFRVEVWDDDPASPTYYLGPWGKRPKFLVSPLILTAGQALLSGQAQLQTLLGATETVSLTAPSNPAHDAGDVIHVERSRLKVDNRYIADQFTLPIGVGAMTATCRERRVPQ